MPAMPSAYCMHAIIIPPFPQANKQTYHHVTLLFLCTGQNIAQPVWDRLPCPTHKTAAYRPTQPGTPLCLPHPLLGLGSVLCMGQEPLFPIHVPSLCHTIQTCLPYPPFMPSTTPGTFGWAASWDVCTFEHQPPPVLCHLPILIPQIPSSPHTWPSCHLPPSLA